MSEEWGGDSREGLAVCIGWRERWRDGLGSPEGDAIGLGETSCNGRTAHGKPSPVETNLERCPH